MAAEPTRDTEMLFMNTVIQWHIQPITVCCQGWRKMILRFNIIYGLRLKYHDQRAKLVVNRQVVLYVVATYDICWIWELRYPSGM